jgi:DNA-binding IclR family transcriptional regulator
MPKLEGTKSKGGVASLDRAFAVLGSFLPEDTSGLTLAELSDRTGLYKSTILRLTESMIRFQYLHRSADGRYQIGAAPLLLAAHYQRGTRLGDVLLPIMREVAEASGESVSFYVRRESVRVCLLRIDSKHNVREHVLEGDILPLHRGSGGRVLMAFAGARGEIFDRIRSDCSYISVGERDAETNGVSAPVFGVGGRLVGALTLTGPRFRFHEKLVTKMRPLILRAASSATSALAGETESLELAIERFESRAKRKRSQKMSA